MTVRTPTGVLTTAVIVRTPTGVLTIHTRIISVRRCNLYSMLTRAILMILHRKLQHAHRYEVEWLRDKLNKGQKFYIVFFGGDIDVCTVADWAGIMSVVEKTSPACAKKLAPHVKTMQEMAACDPEAWKALSSQFETLSRDAYRVVSSFDGYAASPIDTVEHARAFLRHTLKCTPLYQGDGYAYDEDGIRGVAEALVPRMRIADLPLPSTGVKSPLFCISDDL